MIRKISLALVMVFGLVALTGCFGIPIRQAIQENQTGVIMHDGVAISSIVGAGRYSDGALHAKMVEIDNGVQQLVWEGDDLWTKDKQPLDFIITITYHRTRDAAVIKQLWGTYRHLFTSDKELHDYVISRVPEAAKEMTVTNSLEGMLGISEEGGRNKAVEFLATNLAVELSEFGVVLDNVTIDTITASGEYIKKLQEKANASLQVELSKQLTLQKKEQINQEEAQTKIELEVARRNNLVAEELAKVYEQSPEYLELRKLELMGNIIGKNDKLWFIPQGTDLTVFLNQSGNNVVPVN